MPKAEVTVKLQVKIKKKDTYFVSYCPSLNVLSQGNTEAEARENIIEAVRMFIESCFERGTLDAALRECGFRVQKRRGRSIPEDHTFINVPIPFDVLGHCPTECHV